MEKISFYDLDYIININERRLDQYSNAYQKNLDKFTNILIIYSAIAIFLIPIIQTLFFTIARNWLHYISFFLFLFPFLYSLVFTIRLLIPVEVAYLIEPKVYYEKLRLEYESEGKRPDITDKYLKASYINELEKAVFVNNHVFKRKGLFYFRAFSAALIALVPYLFCLAFHFSIKNETIQKVELVTNEKVSNFKKREQMSNETLKNKGSNSSTTTTTTTQLPGINSNEVKPSNPQMIKENFNNQNRKVEAGSESKK